MSAVRIKNMYDEALAAEVSAFAMNEGRICIAIYSGATTTHLRPTADEALKLIAAIHAALSTEKVEA